MKSVANCLATDSGDYWTLTDDFAGVDIAGLDNGRPDIDGAIHYLYHQ